jgi:CBS domain-containing protein
MLTCEVMTSGVATVRADAPITEAIALMEARRVSGLPVVDAYGRLVGVLTEGDLLRRIETGTAGQKRARWLDLLLGPGRSAGEYVRTHSRRVEDLMTREVATVTERTPLEDVVALMERKHVKRVPVVRDGELVGVVSRADLVRALGHALKTAAMGGTVDAALRERLQANLRAQSWFPARDVSIAVKGGVVTLEGIVGDERTRAALRVAAQNVAGVATVEDRLTWPDPLMAGPVI